MALVLVIEDDALMRRTVQRILVGDGHEVIEAENGRVGLDLLRTHTPKLVITDILMPETEGLETIREIRKSNPGMKIIAISGGGAGSDAPVLTWAHRLGADAMLPKPFRAAELLEAVRKLLPSGS